MSIYKKKVLKSPEVPLIGACFIQAGFRGGVQNVLENLIEFEALSNVPLPAAGETQFLCSGETCKIFGFNFKFIS